jgi:hypothetical protein
MSEVQTMPLVVEGPHGGGPCAKGWPVVLNPPKVKGVGIRFSLGLRLSLPFAAAVTEGDLLMSLEVRFSSFFLMGLWEVLRKWPLKLG